MNSMPSALPSRVAVPDPRARDLPPTVPQAFRIEEGNAKPTDAQLRHQIIAEFETTRGVDAQTVDVIVQDGVVTLTGHVPYSWHRHTAARTALHVPGVRAVANDVTVRTGAGNPSDARIAASVADALTACGAADGVGIEVCDGNVILTGRVDGADTRIRVGDLADRSGRAHRVENRLALTRPAIR
ncbi:BON domain-containing protein [Herbiconiux sp. VKM Ac-1786]|uniref:BON domain-containing protein n=1 Tax=Herbiconiux sp. VKM Ac-1786 TaxID=2783824 RepID=UPI00188CCE70|nr:BON domain-containing protein [Herbiconiux sp. VKM Ac-1786]MBF4571933.1 BON domain-containing protein [Herbiconiux sp. VKM Ac-1786]